MPALDAVLREVDILLVNDAEARALTEEHNLLKTYQKVQALGPSILVVKRGEYGVALFTPDGIFAAPAYPAGGRLRPHRGRGHLRRRLPGLPGRIERTDVIALKHATLIGIIMASFTVEKFSTERLEQISQDEVRNRFIIFRHDPRR